MASKQDLNWRGARIAETVTYEADSRGTYYSTERNGTERLFRKIPILRNDQLRC